MVLESSIEPYQPFLATLAVPDQKCTEAVSEEDILALQVGNLRNPQPRGQGQVYDEVVPYSDLVATDDCRCCLFPRCLEEPVYFFPGEELPGIQDPVGADHIFLSISVLLSKRLLIVQRVNLWEHRLLV